MRRFRGLSLDISDLGEIAALGRAGARESDELTEVAVAQAVLCQEDDPCEGGAAGGGEEDLGADDEVQAVFPGSEMTADHA